MAGKSYRLYSHDDVPQNFNGVYVFALHLVDVLSIKNTMRIHRWSQKIKLINSRYFELHVFILLQYPQFLL
jgi:hypothetical protein